MWTRVIILLAALLGLLLLPAGLGAAPSSIAARDAAVLAVEAVPGVGTGLGGASNTAQENDELDKTDEERVRHSRLSLALRLAQQAWALVILAGILLGGLSPRLRDLARRATGGRLGSLWPFLAVVVSLLILLGLPIEFFRGYVLERQFGLSNQSAAGWLVDAAISLGVVIVLATLFFVPIYLLIRRGPRRWWLYGAGMMAAISIVVTAALPVVVDPLFSDFRPLEDQDLKASILDLSARGGIQVSDVVVVDTSRRTEKINAYYAGIGPSRRIVLSDTLLEKLAPEETVAVVAHEMGHQAHADLWRGIAVAAVMSLAGFYVTYRSGGWLLSHFARRFGFDRFQDAASLPLLLLLLGLFFALTQPVANTASRYIEHQADIYALDLVEDNSALAGALDKIYRINMSDPNPPAWIELLFYDHPSIQHRMEFIQAYRQ